jgi:hypothetical protein
MRVYSRPEIPSTPVEYYKRPSFGEIVYEQLRPE